MECIMNWGKWYSSPKNFTFVSNSELTFSQALSDLTSKNKILPDIMMYFLDFEQLKLYEISTEKLKNSIAEEIRKNDFDNDIG